MGVYDGWVCWDLKGKGVEMEGGRFDVGLMWGLMGGVLLVGTECIDRC